MPGNVPLADATDTFPRWLAKEFQRSRNYPVLVNEQPSGDSVREIDATNSQRHWRVNQRLSADKMSALRAFYLAHTVDAFYFYDIHDSDDYATFHYDVTGSSANGRWVVRFTTPWEQTGFVGGRGAVTLEMVELASVGAAAQFNFQPLGNILLGTF